MYEAMVKEAYDNIVGFEKEAEVLQLPPAKKSTIAKTKARNAGRAIADAFTGKELRDIHRGRKSVMSDLSYLDKDELKAKIKDLQAGRGNYVKPALKTLGAYTGAAAALGAGIYGGKKLYDKKKAQKAQQALEAAETQKEAAEYDYTEACAYEDAALEILAELGYDIDAFAKEASEDYDYDDGMTVEEMDEAAFSYLADRGYFDED